MQLMDLTVDESSTGDKSNLVENLLTTGGVKGFERWTKRLWMFSEGFLENSYEKLLYVDAESVALNGNLERLFTIEVPNSFEIIA